MNKFYLPTKLINSAPMITLLALLVVILLGAVILWPKFQELKIIQKNIEEKKAELQSKKEYFSKLNEIKIELGKYEEELSKINSALPENPSLPTFFNFLQKTSSQTGLVLKEVGAFSVSPSKDFPNLQETTLSLKLLGSYSSFKDFLSTLEKSARLIETENISFSSPEAKPGAEEEKEPFAFNLKLKTYSY